MSSGIEEMEAELVAGDNAGNAGFSLCIEKISQGLRKFRNHSENFAIPAKFRYAHFFRYDREISLSQRKFAIIAKITVHRENSNFRYASHFRYDSEIHYA